MPAAHFIANQQQILTPGGDSVMGKFRSLPSGNRPYPVSLPKPTRLQLSDDIFSVAGGGVISGPRKSSQSVGLVNRINGKWGSECYTYDSRSVYVNYGSRTNCIV